LPKNLNCLNCPLKPTLFNSMREDELKIISDNRIIVRYKANETVVKQNSPASQSFCMKSGLAKLYIEGLDGKNIIIKYIKPGSFTGISGMYTDGKYSYCVKTIEDSFFCFTDYKVIDQVLEHNIKFSKQVIKALSNEIKDQFSNIINLSQKNTGGRIATALIYLSEKVFASDELKVSRLELSEYTQMSKDSVSRVLKDFQASRLISNQGSFIKILKFEDLKGISKYG